MDQDTKLLRKMDAISFWGFFGALYTMAFVGGVFAFFTHFGILPRKFIEYLVIAMGVVMFICAVISGRIINRYCTACFTKRIKKGDTKCHNCDAIKPSPPVNYF